MITLRNRLSILPPILLFLALASAPFAANQAECDACAWPYTSGVNQDGECYPTYQGYQGALGTSCAAYCNTWQAAADTLQSMYAVKAFGDAIGGSAPLCECVRLNKGGFVSYKTRPHGTCDWGVSDATQRYWDSLAVRKSLTDSVQSIYQTVDSSWSNFRASMTTAQYAGNAIGPCMTTNECYYNHFDEIGVNCAAAPVIQVMYAPGYTAGLAIPLPSGASCIDLYPGQGANPVALSVHSGVPDLKHVDTVDGWYSYDGKILWLAGGAVHASGVDTGSHYGLHAVDGGGWIFCRPRALASGSSAGFGTEMVSEGGSGSGGPAPVDRSSMPSGGLP